MEYHVKNMVCARCINTVTRIFREEGAILCSVNLGVVEVQAALTQAQFDEIRKRLETEGFEVLDDQRSKLIEQIKNTIVGLVHHGDLDEQNENLSVLLSQKLHKDYHYLSTLFSSVQDTTIEQYFILQKIEKAKELLVYDELTLSQISFQLGYSSVAHLSSQFKKVTGFTPSAFKKLKGHHRQHLDRL